MIVAFSVELLDIVSFRFCQLGFKMILNDMEQGLDVEFEVGYVENFV